MAASRKFLTDSRALWRRREISRYRRWKAAKTTPTRAYYFSLYEVAKKERRARDQQLAALPKPARSVSAAGERLVAQFEGFSSKPYQDSVGVWTIGFGQTKGVGPSTAPWTRARAESDLRVSLTRDYMPAVLAVNPRLMQRPLDGFVSFVYNVGTGGVSMRTKVGRYLRAGNIPAAANALLAWDKAGGRPLLGLTRRRRAERDYILKK